MRRMTAGEVRVARDYLGMTPQQLGEAIGGISARAVQNFEWGKYAVPHELAANIRDLQKYTRERVNSLAVYLRENPQATVAVFTDGGRDQVPDPLPPAYHDVAKYGTKWWRLVVARATEDLPDAHVGTPTEIHKHGKDWWEVVTQKPANGTPAHARDEATG